MSGILFTRRYSRRYNDMEKFPEWNKKGEKDMAYLGEEIKKLGFGLMRLPQKSEGVIDVEQTKVMVDKFMEAGFTYFDTAWAYAGSEDAIREALVERYPREKYQLATKMAAWINCKTRDEALAQFKTSLERTKAGYFDFYLLHNLGEHRTKYFDEYGLWDWIREQKEAGLIKHAGFSFHATAGTGAKKECGTGINLFSAFYPGLLSEHQI